MESTSVVKKHDFLWLVLFLIVFINGFEAGGYQASLWDIGQHYDLSITSMGLFAATELFATMLAPLILGSWADRHKKSFCILIMLAIQLAAALLVFFTTSNYVFVIGIFFLGLTTSALQFISIAALADAYPVSGKKKIGFITSMYALGALISPLVVRFYLGIGMGWRTLFVLLACGSIIAIYGMTKSGSEPREFDQKRSENIEKGKGEGRFLLFGIILLCVIMCIYVGFENGFTFFIDTLFTDVLLSSNGKFALSLFWAVMIPARILVGYFSKYSTKILMSAVLIIPAVTATLALNKNSTAVLLLCIPLGLASGAIYPSCLTIMMSFAGKKTATATGMITTATGIGGFAFTALTGFVGDNFGMRTAMAVLAGFFIFSFIAALCINEMVTKMKNEK